MGARGLSRPGGNITGVSVDAGIELLGKRLEVLREAVPTTALYFAGLSSVLLHSPWTGAALTELT